jgi:hypothetical protein
MAYGILEYNEEGKPKCEICGKFFNRVISHVRQKHFLNEKEYKKQFGFDLKRGICSKESSEKSRIKTLDNYEKCINQNLKIKGFKNRFKLGDKGRTKDKVSEQTRIRLKERLKDSKMIESMKLSGIRLGKSGLGNLKRWKNE